MNTNSALRPTADELDQYEEIALATAQSDMESVIAKSGLQLSEVAAIMGRPRSFISKIMSGGHNLTIRTMARLFAACGLELRFGKVATAPAWGVVTLSVNNVEQVDAGRSEVRAAATVSATTRISDRENCLAA